MSNELTFVNRKSLYQSVFEFDTPLMHPAPCQFEFVPADECDADNPWKESFRQLYYGIHVRPNYRPKKDSRIKHFNTIRVSCRLCVVFVSMYRRHRTLHSAGVILKSPRFTV